MSDGRRRGTRLVRDIIPGMDGSNPYAPTRMGKLLFFGAENGPSGVELWKLRL